MQQLEQFSYTFSPTIVKITHKTTLFKILNVYFDILCGIFVKLFCQIRTGMNASIKKMYVIFM